MRVSSTSSPTLIFPLHNRPHRRSSSSSTSLSLSMSSLTTETQQLPVLLTSVKPLSPTTGRRLPNHRSSLSETTFVAKPDPNDLKQNYSGKEFAPCLLFNDSKRFPERPALVSCTSSYSKRRVSFDSPCELPLPPLSLHSLRVDTAPQGGSSPLASRGQGFDASDCSSAEHTAEESGEKSSFSSKVFGHLSSTGSQIVHPDSGHLSAATRSDKEGIGSPDRHQAQSQFKLNTLQGSQSLGMPDCYSITKGDPSDNIHNPSSEKLWPDRSSSSSLPLPTQTPYHTLPTAGSILEEDREMRQTGGFTTGRSSESKHEPYAGLNMHRPALRLPADPSLVSNRFDHQPSPTTHLATAIRSSLSQNATRPTSSTSSQTDYSYPAPDPPTILTPPQSEYGEDEDARTPAPYVPFLSHAPPPEDSWIAVETTVPEYRLIVRLPGFRRDSITLATRRRRILHVVADSWEANGGHFERRISFGYDADLSQVRAEFDGELLRIMIPRRLPPVNTWYTPATAATPTRQ